MVQTPSCRNDARNVVSQSETTFHESNIQYTLYRLQRKVFLPAAMRIPEFSDEVHFMHFIWPDQRKTGA
jgi:hypothetical protein